MAGQVGLCIAQGVLGPVLTQLLEGITKLVKANWQFRGFTEEIESDFQFALKRIQELEAYNTELNTSNEYLNRIRKKIEAGLKLVRKCSKVGRWKLYRKYRYTTRLEKLRTVLNTLLDGLEFEKVRDEKVRLIMSKKNDQPASAESWVKRIKEWVKDICSTVAAWVKRQLSFIE